MNINAKKFKEQVQTELDRRGWSMDDLSKRCTIDQSTIYRILHEQVNTVSRKTARDICEAFEIGFTIEGDVLRFSRIRETNDENIELIKRPAPYGIRSQRQQLMGRIFEMLVDVDSDVLEMANRFVEVLVRLDREELVELDKLNETLLKHEDKELWLKKMRALIELATPFTQTGVGSTIPGE